MKRIATLKAVLLALAAPAAFAHAGPEAMGQHFFEHMAIAFALAIPVGYGLYQWRKSRAEFVRTQK